MLTVCTGWSPAGYIEYGKRFLDTFHRHWPAEVGLIAYTEEPVPMPRGQCRSLWDIPGAKAFIDRHKDWPAANGRKPIPTWKPSAVRGGYNWRYDAWKFSRQAYIPLAASEGLSGLLCWLDADVITFRDVPVGFIESQLPAGKAVAYLGRHGMHSEIGFQLYRLPDARPLLQAFRDTYDSDAVFGLPQWHSAYVWDVVRKASGIAQHSLTSGTGHVWQLSPLAAYTDHLKGQRKGLERSPEARR